MLAVVTIVAIATFRMQPIYVATARVEIDRENANILPFQGADSYDYMVDLEITSRRNPRFSPAKHSPSKPFVIMLSPRAGIFFAQRALGSRRQRQPCEPEASPRTRRILGSLSVKRVPNSRLMDVSFESTDPQLAARIVNAHIASYIEQNFRSKYEATTQASTWLADQLGELKIRVQKSEDARIAYERQNQIWTLDDKQNITTQRLSDINKQLTDAQSERMKKESLYQFAKAGNLDAVPEVQNNSALGDLFKKRSGRCLSVHRCLGPIRSQFPQGAAPPGSNKEFDQTIEKEKQKILDVLESDYHEAQQREALLTRALDQQKADTNQMAGRLVEYNILKREAEANKTLYEGLMTKLKETAISQGLRSSNIRVVDPAMIPSTPARPPRLVILHSPFSWVWSAASVWL